MITQAKYSHGRWLLLTQLADYTLMVAGFVNRVPLSVTLPVQASQECSIPGCTTSLLTDGVTRFEQGTQWVLLAPQPDLVIFSLVQKLACIIHVQLY